MQQTPPHQQQGAQQSQVAASCVDYLHAEAVALIKVGIALCICTLPHREYARLLTFLRTPVRAQARASSQGHGPEAHAVQLEAVGFHVGQKLVERMVKDRAPLAKELDVIRFIGREFWAAVFRKQLDKLQTNHNVRVHLATPVCPRGRIRCCKYAV